MNDADRTYKWYKWLISGPEDKIYLRFGTFVLLGEKA